MQILIENNDMVDNLTDAFAAISVYAQNNICIQRPSFNTTYVPTMLALEPDSLPDGDDFLLILKQWGEFANAWYDDVCQRDNDDHAAGKWVDGFYMDISHMLPEPKKHLVVMMEMFGFSLRMVAPHGDVWFITRTEPEDEPEPPLVEPSYEMIVYAIVMAVAERKDPQMSFEDWHVLMDESREATIEWGLEYDLIGTGINVDLTGVDPIVRQTLITNMYYHGLHVSIPEGRRGYDIVHVRLTIQEDVNNDMEN